MTQRCIRCQRRLFKEQFCGYCGIHVDTIDETGKTKTVQLWRMLHEDELIQPGDYYASSLTGHLRRCTPDMMGKKLPYMHMPHLRPAGTRVETIPEN